MSTDIFRLFTSLGLSETETKVYFASLNLGPAPVQEIAKKANLSRTATYTNIEALQNRGLMSSHERGKKRVFAAEEPERALSHFKEHVHEMQEKLETLNKVLPEVKMLGGGERPAVRFFEGQEALSAIFTDVASVAPDSLRELSNMEDVYNLLDSELLKDVRMVLDPGKIKINLLHIGELTHRREKVTYRFLDKNKLGEFHGDIWIYGNRVAFVSFVGKIIAVVLENKIFAETAKVLFDAAWDGAEKDR
ncbi:MAG: helix-turn-helix domain-containing protein [Patescibacteria group bacterium]|jgi:sugar-specific transcriptional regulator TrmB